MTWCSLPLSPVVATLTLKQLLCLHQPSISYPVNPDALSYGREVLLVVLQTRITRTWIVQADRLSGIPTAATSRPVSVPRSSDATATGVCCATAPTTWRSTTLFRSPSAELIPRTTSAPCAAIATRQKHAPKVPRVRVGELPADAGMILMPLNIPAFGSDGGGGTPLLTRSRPRHA